MWEAIAAAVVLGLVALVGMAITLLGLPGIWLTIIAAVIAQWIMPGLFSWWTLGVCVGLGLLAELLEFLLGAAGAAKAGGSKRAALAAIVGGVVGGILGTPWLPVIGTIIGAALGAGVAAMAFERTKPGRTWEHATNVGTGAAVGRFAATIVKSTLNGVIAAIIVVAALVR